MVQESPYRQPEMQTSHPYIPNIPNPYAYPQHMATGHHNIHAQEHSKSQRPVQQSEMCFQGEKNQVKILINWNENSINNFRWEVRCT